MESIPLPTISRCPDTEYSGELWRMHSAQLRPDSFEGYLHAAGRVHVLGEGRTGYFSTGPYISIAESARHFEPQEVDFSCVGSVLEIAERLSSGFRDYLESRLLTLFEARLQRVKDCRDLTVLGISEEVFLQNRRGVDWEQGGHISQRLGHAVRIADYEGLLVPSATKLGPNLILFPDNLLPDSILQPRKSGNPLLYPTDW